MTITSLISELKDNLNSYGDMDVKFLSERRENGVQIVEVSDVATDRERHPFGTVRILSLRKYAEKPTLS